MDDLKFPIKDKPLIRINVAKLMQIAKAENHLARQKIISLTMITVGGMIAVSALAFYFSPENSDPLTVGTGSFIGWLIFFMGCGIYYLVAKDISILYSQRWSIERKLAEAGYSCRISNVVDSIGFTAQELKGEQSKSFAYNDFCVSLRREGQPKEFVVRYNFLSDYFYE